MSQPTILQIVPELDTGGAELSAVEIGEAIARVGGRALIATEGGRLEEQAVAQGAEIIRFAAATKNPARIVANAYRLARIVRDENVAILHARSRAPAWSALMAARLTGKPFVTTYHGAYGERGRVKRLYNSVMARADRVIANSHYTADLIRQRYGTPDDRVRVIHRGVDRSFDREMVSGERISAMRSRWGVSDDQRVILQAARLTGWKGQSVLISAAAELRDQDGLQDSVVVIAGDAQGRDHYRDRLQAEISRFGLERCVRLVGHESDMAVAFAAAHISVVASTEPEAFGRAATESQALGCPVIATRIGAPPETVLAAPDFAPDAMTGWLVPPGDSGALAAALREALQMGPDQREALGQRAAAHVRENFSLEQMKRKTLQVYDELQDWELEKAFISGQHVVF